jgi:flagellar motility protein MotE (MotC chaperone)
MTIFAPRLLPATTVAIAALLGMKGLELVRAATPEAGTAQIAPAPPPPSNPAKTTPAASGTPDAPAPTSVSESEKAVLVELRQRRQELESREQAIAAREAILAAAEHKIDQRISELQALQQRLEALEATRMQRVDANWQGLVRLYTSMKPRDAAKIFDDLETPVLLEVVDRMNERKAAPILAAMQPDRAREITAKLADLRLKREGGNP